MFQLKQSELNLQEPCRCLLPDQLPCSPSYQCGWLFILSAPLFILSAPLPHSRLLRMALPAGLHSAPGVFCPDFSLAAGAEKARLFRISMTMGCNAVTGVGGPQTGCKIPGQQQIGQQANKPRKPDGKWKCCSTSLV